MSGLEELVILTPSLVDGMADLVYSVLNGKPNNPVLNNLISISCSDPTLDYGVLSTQNSRYCIQTCATDPACLWSAFDTKTSKCVGGEYTCTNLTMTSTVNLNRVSLKVKMNIVTYNGITITDEAFISAPAHLFRPATRQILRKDDYRTWEETQSFGSSCMLTVAGQYDECQWTKVANMRDKNYQHPATGITNIYELISWGAVSVANETEPVYVCPELANAWASIWVGEEGSALRVSSCASYLSNDVQQNFAVVVYDSNNNDCQTGDCRCYLLPTCGSSSSPMIPYDQAFQNGLPSRLNVAILAKESHMQPHFLDTAEGSDTLREASNSVMSTRYEDAVKQVQSDDIVKISDRLFSGQNCLANHHPYYDPSMYATSSICLPVNCSIWGTSNGYRNNMRFMETTCATHPSCCADSYDADALPACNQMKNVADGQYRACAIKLVGSSNISLHFPEFEMLPSISSHVLTDSNLYQLKRNQAENLKYNRDAIKSLCTVKIDLYDLSSFGNDRPVIALDEYSGIDYATHVSETCATGIKSDPRRNELVITNGKKYTHISRSQDPSDDMLVVMQSSMAPYDERNCSVYATAALYNLGSMIESTTTRGTGLWDKYRPSHVAWIRPSAGGSRRRLAGVYENTLDTYALSYTESVQDGSTYNDYVTQTRRGPTSYLPLSTIFVSPISATSQSLPPKSVPAVEERTIHGNGDVGICFSLCNNGMPFKLVDLEADYSSSSNHGYAKVYLSLDDISAGDPGTSASNIYWKDYFVDNVTYRVPVNDQKTVTSFEDMHDLDPEVDTVILEVREHNQQADYRRLTYRSLDKGNIARQGGVCVDRLPLVPNKVYEISAQHIHTSATMPLICSTTAGNVTMDYLGFQNQASGRTVLTSTFPLIKYIPQDQVKEQWKKRYHDASNFIVRNPDNSQDSVLSREIEDIIRNAFTETDIETMLYQLCDDVSHAENSVARNTPIAACHGFTYRKRMNPEKLIKAKNGTADATYGDFCWQGVPSLYTNKEDCELAYYGRPCNDSGLAEKFARFDEDGHIQEFVNGVTLYQINKGNPEREDYRDIEGRIGGSVRSACNTYKDKPFEFFDVVMYITYPPNADVTEAIQNAADEMQNNPDTAFTHVVSLTQTWLASTDYSITQRVLNAGDSVDRKTYLLQDMYTTVGNKLSESMRNASLYMHTDLITANAFRCGLPTVESDFDSENGVYEGIFSMTFRWHSVLTVNDEPVVDESIQFAWGRTTEDAAVALQKSTEWGSFDFLSLCAESDQLQSPETHMNYYRETRMCPIDKSIKWKTNPEGKVYGNPLNADPSDATCAAKSADMQFVGILSDFLDMTNEYPPVHIIREDLAGSYTHKTQLAVRQILHMQSGNTVERTMFYPLYIKTYSTNVMSFSAQSPTLPAAVSRLKDISVQYNYATYRSVLEFSTRTCVSQPKNTTDENTYELVDPIIFFDRTQTNPSTYKELRDLGKAKYGLLSDGFTATAGASAEVRLLNAGDTRFTKANPFQGANDARFFENDVHKETCVLVVQDSIDEDMGIPGTNAEFESLDQSGLNGNKYFEFNCFRRVYVCEFDNAKKWGQMHVHISSDYIIKSSNLYIVDPLVPETVSFVSTISTTVEDKVDTQSFQVAMVVDVPADLNDLSTMPSWETYHEAGSAGMLSLRGIAAGKGNTADRIEREQRFRVSAYFTDAGMRESYGLYPVSLFAILTLKDAKRSTMQSSNPMSSTGESILTPKTELCGITADMAKNLSSFETFGKLVPIYEGIFRNGTSASDNSFYNPSMLKLDQFLHHRAIDPELSSLLRSRQIYVSDALRNDLLPESQKGGMDIDSSALSWLLVNNIDLDYTGLDHTFDINFCFVGAVTSKDNMRMDTAMLSVQARLNAYVPYDKAGCRRYYEGVLNLEATGVMITYNVVTEANLPSGCLESRSKVSLGEAPSFIAVSYNDHVNSLKPVVDHQLLCANPYGVLATSYETASAGYNCAQHVVRFRLSLAECQSAAGPAGVFQTTGTSTPAGCFVKDAKWYFNSNDASEVKCSASHVCRCSNADNSRISAKAYRSICYERVTTPPSAGSKKLLGYTSSKIKIGPRSNDGFSDYAQNSATQHTVGLMSSFRPRNTDVPTSFADDQSQSTTSSATAGDGSSSHESASESSDDDEHDDHDSKRMRALLAVAIAIVSVFVILLLAGVITISVDISSNMSRTRTRGTTAYASVSKTSKLPQQSIQSSNNGRGGRARAGAKQKSYLKL
ncbi:hypothetical protein CYMTET_55102 [Cymbomonas tetramitiformis]|uniref:Uncharacterized protein n=1 Tax=Cymbomonas tetramitiformis TaxID=36881 RepID=A0AAE0BDG4_9CHLO|nr:hypothetical protein CYMTET_55102 [Cymbomonas tetramitiformis]